MKVFSIAVKIEDYLNEYVENQEILHRRISKSS